MANSETDFCVEIRNDVMDQLGPAHNCKHSDGFILGIADLQFQTWHFGHWLVEAKFLRAAESTKDYPVKMTAHQRKFIREEQEAGGQAGWALCVRYSDRLSHLYVGADHTIERVARDAPHVVRKHGEAWDTRLFFNLLKVDHARTAAKRPPSIPYEPV